MSAPGSPSGSGKNWSPRSARHAGIDNKKDLKEQAEMRLLFENPSAVEYEVIDSIGRANYLPALDRLSSDLELYDFLRAAATKGARTCQMPRADRPKPKKNGQPQTRPNTPKNAVEYFHANFPPSLLLALRWAAQRGLANPTPALNANLRFVAELTKKQYGVRVVASIRHTPNPYTIEKTAQLGWPRSRWDLFSEKIGGWNLHVQVYCSRVTDGRFVCKHRSFRYCGDVMIATLWLKELGVNVHQMARVSKEVRLIRDYAVGRINLPVHLTAKVAAKKMSREQAVALCVAGKMSAWDAKWKKSKGAKNAGDRIADLLTDKRLVQEPVDWFISMKATEDIVKRLVDLDPAYAALLEKGKTVYAHMKKQHYEGGYERSLNDLLTEFERDDAAADAKEQAVRHVDSLIAEIRIQEQQSEISKLSSQNEILIQSEKDRKAAENAAKAETEQLKGSLSTLEAENAALIEAVQEANSPEVPFEAEFMLAALADANALVNDGHDLSTLPPEIRRAVEIQPATRIKRIAVVIEGKRELVPVLDKGGNPIREPNPEAGRVGLTREALQFALKMTGGADLAAPIGVSSDAKLEASDGSGSRYGEVLRAHQASLAVERVSWHEAIDAIGRIQGDVAQKGDEKFLDPKYRVMALKAASGGDRTAASFIGEYDAYKDHLTGLEIQETDGINTHLPMNPNQTA
jgi:hypothetical protein